MNNAIAAVVREKSGPFLIEDVRLEDPRADEVLVQIVGTGICHTDLIIRDQYFPTELPVVLGHEGSGIVVKVGSDVTKVAPGDHVVLTYAACGECGNCKKGHYAYCPSLYDLNLAAHRPDGSSPCCSPTGEKINAYFFSQSSFANYAIANAQNVVKIRDDVNLEIMGPLAAAFKPAPEQS